MSNESWEDMVARSIDIGSIQFDKPDIDDYLREYEPEWLDVWENSPVEEMTEGQILALIDLLSDMPFDDWPEYDADFDYWEWFRGEYGGD